MAVTFNLSGLDQVTRNLAAVAPQLAQAAKAAVVDTMGFAEVAIADHIDKHDAIDHGQLKGSITQKDEVGRDGKSYTFDPKDTAADLSEVNGPGGVSRIDGVVGTNVQHAIPVHEGYTTRRGRHIDGRPFMADALPEIEAHFEKTAREMIGDVLR